MGNGLEGVIQCILCICVLIIRKLGNANLRADQRKKRVLSICLSGVAASQVSARATREPDSGPSSPSQCWVGRQFCEPSSALLFSLRRIKLRKSSAPWTAKSGLGGDGEQLCPPPLSIKVLLVIMRLFAAVPEPGQRYLDKRKSYMPGGQAWVWTERGRRGEQREAGLG